jgi:hypothetical protein
MGFPDAWLTCWKEFLLDGKMSIEVWTQIPTCLEVWSFHACQQHSFNAKTIRMSLVWFNICNALMFDHPSIAIIHLLSSSTKNLTRWHLNACNSPEPIHSYGLCILAWTYLRNLFNYTWFYIQKVAQTLRNWCSTAPTQSLLEHINPSHPLW